LQNPTSQFAHHQPTSSSSHPKKRRKNNQNHSLNLPTSSKVRILLKKTKNLETKGSQSQGESFTMRIFSQIWLKAKYQSKNLKTSLYIFGYLLEPCTDIWLLNKKWSKTGY
jgi:hypothetical protein